MTVTTNGWAYLEYDCLATYTGNVGSCANTLDEGTTEGTAGTDSVGIRVPVDGAVVYEDLAQCDIKVNHTGTAKYEVNASSNDSTTVGVNGTVGGSDPASVIPLVTTGTATCPTSFTKAAYVGSLTWIDNVTGLPATITDG
jgi:hypothetical protein